MCEFVLKKQRVNYVEKVCQKHLDLHRPDIKNPTQSIAVNRLRSMLFDQMQNTAATKQRNQRLEDLMLFDPHIKYAKSIGVEDTKIRYALLNQMEKKSLQFLVYVPHLAVQKIMAREQRQILWFLKWIFSINFRNASF